MSHETKAGKPCCALWPQPHSTADCRNDTTTFRVYSQGETAGYQPAAAVPEAAPQQSDPLELCRRQFDNVRTALAGNPPLPLSALAYAHLGLNICAAAAQPVAAPAEDAREIAKQLEAIELRNGFITFPGWGEMTYRDNMQAAIREAFEFGKRTALAAYRGKP